MDRARSRQYLHAVGVTCWVARTAPTLVSAAPAPPATGATMSSPMPTISDAGTPAESPATVTPELAPVPALSAAAPPIAAHSPPSSAAPFVADISAPVSAPDTAPVSPAPVSAAAIAPVIATMDWTALERAVTTCQQCALCHERNRTVFGYGDRHADVLLIGEAPGRDEDEQGVPFVGRAGQLLTRMLAAMGWTREQVYICNVIKCRPPQNRDPLSAEIAQCQPYLARQIALVAPKVILCLGRFAAQTLLNSTLPVGHLRGRWHVYAPQQSPLLVTYHPSYYLRAPTEKARGWQDLQELLRHLHTATPAAADDSAMAVD